jgi:dihydrofolate synthase/folylpolyglutamate synthase
MTNSTHPQKSLDEWLAYCEKLHNKAIALGLDRVRRVADAMDLHFDCPVVTVAGTNGKGSTCAMLESIWRAAGYSTGVYASPHLVHFEERLRLDGRAVDASLLVEAFAKVEAARTAPDVPVGGIPLTYFEFTTLAILQVMKESRLDVVILEVGMGGRLDAVNIVDPSCAVITSVDIDHIEFLGKDRETIGREKAGIMRAGKPVVVSDPVPPASVLEYAKALNADLWTLGKDFNFSGDPQQWAWAGRGRRYAGLAYPALRGANQLMNAAGVLAVTEALRELLPVTAQAIRLGFAHVELAGRFQVIAGQPALVLDVAHNPHSAAALAANLDAMGFYPCTHAVVGAMGDKDVLPMLQKMAPIIDKWYFTDLPTPRAASASSLAALWATHFPSSKAEVQCFESPLAALQAASAAASTTDRIVVFGSFYTVGGVMADGPPRWVGASHSS